VCVTIPSVSEYLSLSETFSALGVTPDNFCRAIEEGKVTIPGYLRSGSQPFVAGLHGLVHYSDDERMRDSVMSIIGNDATYGGAELLAALLDTTPSGGSWARSYLLSNLHLFKPWQGRLVDFCSYTRQINWDGIGVPFSGLVRPEQFGDDSVRVHGTLLEYVDPCREETDPNTPFFVLDGTVRLTPLVLMNWAKTGRFVWPVMVAPPSWWTSPTDRHRALERVAPELASLEPESFFCLRYPSWEDFNDILPAAPTPAPCNGYHDTPTGDDLLFRREDVEALLARPPGQGAAAKPKKTVPVSRQNEDRVLDAIKLLNLDPQSLPRNERGKRGCKKDAREMASGLTKSQFDDAWDRLFADGRFKYAT